MLPSLRSRPNHPQQPVPLPWTRDVRGNSRRSRGRLRLSLAGSPPLLTESGSLAFGTAGPPPAAPHPASRRRSCLRLLSRCSSREDSDFHWLISWMCARTRARRPGGPKSRAKRPRRKGGVSGIGSVAGSNPGKRDPLGALRVLAVKPLHHPAHRRSTALRPGEPPGPTTL